MLKTNLIRTVALAALIGGVAFSPLHAAFAQDASSGQPTTTTEDSAPASAVAPSSSQAMSPKMHDKMMMQVETRIKSLHDKLKITAAQENEWSAVAQSMRDNETTVHQLIEQRHQSPDSMTAIDDMQSYQKITQAHADGLQKTISAFEPLYNDMSDDQKKNADEVFGKFEGHRDGMKHHHKAS